MQSTQREETIIPAITAGWIEVRSDGSIWRIAQRRKSRWDGTVTVTKTRPHRVDAVGVGYRTVKFTVDGKQNCALAHRVVWRWFRGPIPFGMQINHKNGNKADNRLENLELVTASGNVRHAVHVLKVGRAADQDGQKNHAAKLSDEQVRMIRERYATGRQTQAELATEYGVRHQQISKIVRGDRRKAQEGPTSDYVSNRQRSVKRNEIGQFAS